MVHFLRMSHRNGLFLLAVIWLLLLPVSIKAELPKPEEILQKLVKASETVDFIGKRIFMTYAPGGAPVREELVIRKAPDKKRVEVLSPPEMQGTAVVIDQNRPGGDMTIKRRDEPFPRDRGNRPPPGKRPFMPPMEEIDEFSSKSVQLLLRNYNISVLDGGRVAQRNTYLLEMESKTAGKPSSKIWTDVKVGLILKMERYDAQKRLQWIFAYNEINFKPKIDESVFNRPDRRPPPPPEKEPRMKFKRDEIWNYKQGKPDIAKIRKDAQLNINLQDQIPGGFALQSVYVMSFDDTRSVHLRYTDGLTILSVFQSSSDGGNREDKPPWEHGNIEKISIKGVECEIISGGPMLIFRWKYGDINSTLIGELNRTEMTKIMGSFIK